MKESKLKQFAISLLVVLSLFASSVSACACSHDSIQSAAGEHCQPPSQHLHEAKDDAPHSHGEAAEHHHADSAETKNVSPVLSEKECCCIKPAPKVFAKSETVKTEKQFAKISSSASVEINVIVQINSVRTTEFIRPFYLSDSFYNLSPGRAPPRL